MKPGLAARGRARDARGISLVPLSAIATGAVVLGHQIAYLLAVPSGAERSSVLAGTGHAYLPTTTRLALLLAVAAAGGLFLRSLTRPEEEPARGPLFRSLALVQAGMFLTMEVAERLATGAPIAGVFSHAILFLGIAVQLLLAFGLAGVVKLLSRANDVAAVLGPVPLPRPRPVIAVPSQAGPFVPNDLNRGVAAPRAPPSA
jgi:hypothetical protein